MNRTSGYVFVNAHNTSLVGWIEEKRPGQNYGRGTEGSTIRYDRGSVNGAGPYFTFSAPLKDESGRTLANLPCQRPPQGADSWRSMRTGEIAWEAPLRLTRSPAGGKQLTGKRRNSWDEMQPHAGPRASP